MKVAVAVDLESLRPGLIEPSRWVEPGDVGPDRTAWPLPPPLSYQVDAQEVLNSISSSSAWFIFKSPSFSFFVIVIIS